MIANQVDEGFDELAETRFGNPTFNDYRQPPLRLYASQVRKRRYRHLLEEAVRFTMQTAQA